MKNLKEIIRKVLEEHVEKTLVLTDQVEISEALQYHIDNQMSLTNNVFRVYSEKYLDLRPYIASKSPQPHRPL